MLDANIFLSDEKRPSGDDRLRKARQAALELLARAVRNYRRARKLPKGSFLAGAATAYLLSFKAMAKPLGIDLSRHPFVGRLEEQLEALVPLPGEGPEKTVTVRHVRDPEGLKIERERLEAREKPERERMISDIVRALTSNTLGYGTEEARRLAEKVYRPGATLEELVLEALRSRS